jgi:hypothetical protein
MAGEETPGAGGGGFGGFQISNATFSNIGGAVTDLFSSSESAAGLRIKAQGDIAEGQAYDLAAALAGENEKFTEQSTAIKEMQQQREATLQIGQQRGAIASSGFAESGSALDILRDSASQAALQRQVLGQQGLITEAGYREQQQSYQTMSAAAKSAAAQEQELASKTEFGGEISAAIKGVAAVASVVGAPFTGGLSLAALPGLAAG